MRFHHSMRFKETPKTVDGLILLIEKCMETLDEFKDEHLENHYLLVSNWLMARYKQWDVWRNGVLLPRMEQDFKDRLSEEYARFENLEKELKVSLITTHQFGRNLRRIVDDEEGLVIGKFPKFIEDALDEHYFIDQGGNVYGSSFQGRLINHHAPPIGFIHHFMAILIPVPKSYRDQLNWNDPIVKFQFINDDDDDNY